MASINHTHNPTRGNIRVVTGVPGGDVSQPICDVTIKRDILCPMRDGITLATDIFFPSGDGPFPVIFERTPYDKNNSHCAGTEDYIKRGYVMVVQDVRGRFNSDGDFDPRKKGSGKKGSGTFKKGFNIVIDEV